MTFEQEFHNFCENIRQLRKKAGLSQKEMAEIMGIGLTSLRKLEQGIFPPRLKIDVLIAVSQTFHVSAHSLMEKQEW